MQSLFGNTFEVAVKWVTCSTPSSKRSWASSAAAVYVQRSNSTNKWDIFHCEKFFQRREPQHFYCSSHCGRHFSGFTIIIYIFTFYRKQPSIPSAKHSAVSALKTPCLMKYTICLSSAAFPPALTARGRAGTQGTTKPFRNIHEPFSSVFMAQGLTPLWGCAWVKCKHIYHWVWD